MGEDDVPLDDKSKRMRDLLSSFYSPDHPNSNSMSPKATSRFATLDTINTTPFDADQYMNLLVQKSNLEGLLQRHVEMAAEIKNLDTDLQMLVYENYNKFVSATDAIKRMNNNIVGMETNMEQLLEKIMSVQSRSDGVNTSLFEKREHIEKLHRTRNLLRKVQFIYDLPARLAKCIKSEAYADAVKYYTGAMPIFKDCKRASEEAIAIIIKALQGKVFSDSESIQARAEAVMLLKQLDFPVNNLKVQLFGKLEEFLVDLHLESKEIRHSSSDLGGIPLSPSSCAHEALEATQQHIKKQLASADLVTMLRVIWTNVLLMDEVLPEAGLRDFTFEAAHVAIKQYFACRFGHLLLDISGTLVKVHDNQKGVIEEEYPLQAALEISKNALVQGSMDALLDFRRLLDENLEVLSALTDLIIDWVQEGFQEFFRKLSDQFLVLSRKKYSANQDLIFWEGMQGDKVLPGLVLLLAQLSVFIEQNAITRISEEISPFSGSGYRGHDNGPAFVPAEICRIFQSAGEELLQHYISLKTRKILILLKKRFITPNWVKHKEPREVHMFIDLLLQELDTILNEVKQILPEGLHRKHRRTDSNGSNTSSRSNPLRDDKLVRSNTQKARSQLLESHLAKLFKQKMEIFTKVEHTQESVITTIIKLFLKSLQEFVRLQTFNRSGFQQIQLDIHFLKTTLKDTAEDEAAVDFLLDEVIVAAAERCLDPIPLEPAIVDRLTQAKLAKNSEQSPTS
ncbi:vacuolar protein sorting-associated protein 51 homolog isoform X2 [Nicotiana tabacum]|uniref:Vacuolar protein sorting-associated protein 51 homolog isoform X2 n=1 Tax=Nicotiana tabacum TaxID=4097 RepID=A0AC58T9U1_TOBAC